MDTCCRLSDTIQRQTKLDQLIDPTSQNSAVRVPWLCEFLPDDCGRKQVPVISPKPETPSLESGIPCCVSCR